MTEYDERSQEDLATEERVTDFLNLTEAARCFGLSAELLRELADARRVPSIQWADGKVTLYCFSRAGLTEALQVMQAELGGRTRLERAAEIGSDGCCLIDEQSVCGGELTEIEGAIYCEVHRP